MKIENIKKANELLMELKTIDRILEKQKHLTVILEYVC